MTARYRFFRSPGGGWVVFFPQRHMFVETDSEGVRQLRQWSGGELAADASPYLLALQKAGLLEVAGEADPGGHADEPYTPTGLTLLPTMDCNLRCVYCYASGGERKAAMPVEVGRAAVNFVVANALARNSDLFHITLHGGGEPTLHWEFLTAIVAYARVLAGRLELKCHIAIGSNGNLPEDRRRWLMENLDSATISIDGPQDIHDAQRPCADGRGSYGAVLETIREFEAAGFRYQLRTTVTRRLLPRLQSFVESMAELAPHAQVLQFEPMFLRGRGTLHGSLAPTPREFEAAYIPVARWAEGRRYRASVSACDITGAKERYCGIYGDSFIVTPDGNVTTCYETSGPGDFHWDWFHIGRYAPERRRFEIDADRVRRLREMGRKDLAGCEDCFSRLTCAGDCPAKRIELREAGRPGERCGMIRNVTLATVREKLVSIRPMTQSEFETRFGL